MKVCIAAIVAFLFATPSAADIRDLLGRTILDVRVEVAGVPYTDSSVLQLFETRIGEPLSEAFKFTVTARLPGREKSWSPKLGDPPLDMAADSTVFRWPEPLLAVVAALSLIGLVLVLVVRSLRARQLRG